MKYIRTEDGRIFDVSNEEIIRKPMPPIDSKEYIEIKLYGCDVRVSDTIGELVDFYIGIDTFGKPHYCDGNMPLYSVKLLFKDMVIKALIINDKKEIF